MARLQILELPAATGDDRPPFVLVVDQVPSDQDKFDAIRRDLLSDGDLAPRLGARAVLVFEETIQIPANEPLPLAEVDDAAHVGTDRLVDAHEHTRLELCDALQVPQGTTWRNLVNHARGLHQRIDTRAAALERVRDLPERPDFMDAQHDQPQGYLHGYKVAIGDAKSAARTVRPEFGEAP